MTRITLADLRKSMRFRLTYSQIRRYWSSRSSSGRAERQGYINMLNGFGNGFGTTRDALPTMWATRSSGQSCAAIKLTDVHAKCTYHTADCNRPSRGNFPGQHMMSSLRTLKVGIRAIFLSPCLVRGDLESHVQAHLICAALPSRGGECTPPLSQYLCMPTLRVSFYRSCAQKRSQKTKMSYVWMCKLMRTIAWPAWATSLSSTPTCRAVNWQFPRVSVQSWPQKASRCCSCSTSSGSCSSGGAAGAGGLLTHSA